MAKIRVKVKSTGQTGTLDQSEFDPNVFESLDNAASVSTPQPQSGGFNITPAMASSAQLQLPPTLASKIKAAYDIQSQNQASLEKQATKKKEEDESKAALKGFVDVAQDLKKGTKDITLLNSLPQKVSGALGNETAIKTFERKKALVGQYLAKLVEKGRLSDADRTFYQEQIFNIGPYGGQGGKEEAIDEIISDVVRLTGDNPSNYNLDQKKNEPQDPYAGVNAVAQNPIIKNLLQFGQNAQNETQGMIQGVQQLPGEVARVSQEDPLLGVTKLIGQMGVETIKGYKDLITKPVETTYNKPVSTFFNLIPFTGAIKGKVPKATATTSPSVVPEQVTSVASNPVLDKVLQKGKSTNKVSQMAENSAARVYTQQFNIPTKLAERLKPLETAKQILEYGFSPTDVQGAKAISQSITGSDGVFSKLTRQAVGNVKSSLDLGETLESVNTAASKLPTNVNAADHVRIINDILGGGGERGVMKIDSFEALDKIRQLEQQGYQYTNSSTKMSPNLTNEQIGRLYIEAANTLSEQLDSLSGTEKVVEALKTPENLASLEKVSPRLAQDLKDAKTIKDLRKMQSPFVKLGQMAEITELSGNTPFSNLARGATRASLTAAGGLGGGPLGALLGYLGSPVIESLLEPALPRVQSGLAKILYRGSKVGK